MRKIAVNNELCGKLIAERANTSYRHGHDVVFATVNEEGQILGGVVANDYIGHSMFMHVASVHPSWLTRVLLRVTFDWAFNQANVKRIFSPVLSDNHACLRLMNRLGFVEQTRLIDVTPTADMVIFTCTRETCPWI